MLDLDGIPGLVDNRRNSPECILRGAVVPFQAPDHGGVRHTEGNQVAYSYGGEVPAHGSELIVLHGNGERIGEGKMNGLRLTGFHAEGTDIELVQLLAEDAELELLARLAYIVILSHHPGDGNIPDISCLEGEGCCQEDQPSPHESGPVEVLVRGKDGLAHGVTEREIDGNGVVGHHGPEGLEPAHPHGGEDHHGDKEHPHSDDKDFFPRKNLFLLLLFHPY